MAMNEEQTVRVLLVDDHPLLRAGVRGQLEGQGEIEVVGEAGDGVEGVRLAGELVPDIIFMDINLKGMNGLEATRAVLEAVPRTKVIIFSMHDDEEYVLGAIRAGASGYILKSRSPDELTEAVDMVRRGNNYFSGSIARFIEREYIRGVTEPKTLQLTPRETEVLKLIAAGHINKEIADQLSLSVRTIETYRERLMRKLDIHTAAGLTRYAIAQGLVAAR
jgi:two-component system, NarL family, nitrate/nitrite response regulator NarL